MDELYGEHVNWPDPGVKMVRTCMACPEQYQGEVDGNPAYFRLRHSHWRFCIIEPGGDPIGPGRTPEKKVLFYEEGEVPGEDVGIMQGTQDLIMTMIEKFRKAKEVLP